MNRSVKGSRIASSRNRAWSAVFASSWACRRAFSARSSSSPRARSVTSRSTTSSPVRTPAPVCSRIPRASRYTSASAGARISTGACGEPSPGASSLSNAPNTSWAPLPMSEAEEPPRNRCAAGLTSTIRPLMSRTTTPSTMRSMRVARATGTRSSSRNRKRPQNISTLDSVKASGVGSSAETGFRPAR